ncbi:MAG TPA: MlaD family protein [Candidatus Binataceae bacterium]
MGKKVNPAIVGAFVLAALGLIVTAVVIFGSGSLFRKTQIYVVYFNSSVNGLRAGASVKFRGVEIGAVQKVLLSLGGSARIAAQTTGQVRIPVLIELDPERILSRGGEGVDLNNPEQMRIAIQNGLRAQLLSESFVTGLLYIDLDFHPTKPKFELQANSPYQEIPTMPTPLERAQVSLTRLLAELDQVNFAAMVNSITNAAESIDRLADSPKLQRTLASLDKAAKSLDSASVGIRNVSETLNSEIKPIGKDLHETANDSRAMLDQARSTLKSVQVTLAPGSPFSYQLDQTLAETAAAARSVKELADYLERNPSSLVRGKYESGDHR